MCSLLHNSRDRFQIRGLMAWQLAVYAMRTLEMEKVSMMLKVPFYPLLLVTAFAIILTTLLFISQASPFSNISLKWLSVLHRTITATSIQLQHKGTQTMKK